MKGSFTKSEVEHMRRRRQEPSVFITVQFFNHNVTPWHLYMKGIDASQVDEYAKSLAIALRGDHLRDMRELLLKALEIYTDQYLKLDYPQTPHYPNT